MTTTDKQYIEELAALEHDQWVQWSMSIQDEVSPVRRNMWEKLWIPYKYLSETEKEKDRVWARKVLTILKKQRLRIRNEYSKEIISLANMDINNRKQEIERYKMMINKLEEDIKESVVRLSL